MNNRIRHLPNGDFKVLHCTCHTCYPICATDPQSMFMRLCPDCGNKRCPKATNHQHACTNSNDPDQIGSVYGIVEDPWNNWKANREI